VSDAPAGHGVAPLLVLGWGNRSRGDDALGPLFVEALMAQLGPAAAGRVEALEDYQLQVEHALDLVGRRRVLFVDASLDAAPPFTARALSAARDRSAASHALSPQAVLQVFEDLQQRPAPPSTLLAIRGDDFVLGAPLGDAARAHLAAALDWARGWVAAAPAAAKAGR
jgi:hydrogenase maturation protease